MNSSNRDNWIDIAKIIGMYLIFIGHFGPAAGLAYQWVFSFHVALFFFLSGMLEQYNDRSFIKNIVHKTITIAIPFLFYGCLYTIYLLLTTSDLHLAFDYLLEVLKGGIRNSLTLGAGLWFLSCLYVISIAFSVIKMIRNKAGILIICLVFFAVARLIITPSPVNDPRWLWNVDSACYFLTYYALGYLLFDPIKKALISNSTVTKAGRIVVAFFCVAYSGLLFCGHDLLSAVRNLNIVTALFCEILRPLLSIIAVLFFSILLQRNTFLCRLGQNSLYLCGNESLIKELIPIALSIIGLEKHTEAPMQVLIYSAVLIVAIYYLIIPLEKPLLEKVKNLEHKK